MATSQNGYPVFFSTTQRPGGARMRKWDIPGSNRTFWLRDGSTGFLLLHTALWWDETINPLDAQSTWDEWAWPVRPVRGQSSGYSNHASGTAIDLDATRHPIGVSIYRNLRSTQVAAIRTRMLFYRGCVKWGGDWSRPDGMHFEIAKNLSTCEKTARSLLNTSRGKRILDANPGARAYILS